MSGVLYGVGVGPGDPKLMTYQAVEIIKSCPVLAVPAEGKEYAFSYQIASGMINDLDSKECLNLTTPMTKDANALNRAYEEAANQIIAKLDEGKDVAYLTIGDPTIYCTYIYIHRIVRDKGYDVRIINGIPSFCAVGARLDDSLVDRSEQLHVIPSTYDIEEALDLPGTKVLMKSASKIASVKKLLQEKGLSAKMIEQCSTPDEIIYNSTDEIPDTASYFSIMIVQDR